LDAILPILLDQQQDHATQVKRQQQENEPVHPGTLFSGHRLI
jgi:hypothetical protein